MSRPPAPTRMLLPALALLALALGAPAASLAGEATPSTTVTTTPGPTAEPGAAAEATSTSSAPEAQTTQTGTTPAPETPEAPPQVQAQHVQHASPSSSSAGSHARRGTAGAVQGGEGATEGSTNGDVRAKHAAPSPTTLTPALPFSLRSSFAAGLPSFFIESFQVPPFLLPIFQAAGTAYGIPWQVLAAINEVETDYGRDLSVSSAGAEGWMQFLPSEWAQYGVDANGDGCKDPYNPADAIFAAARYLRAAGGNTNIKAAIFSYNHSAVLRRIGDAARPAARRHPLRTARRDHRPDRGALPGARGLALQRRLPDDPRRRRDPREDARRHDDLLAARRPRDRGARTEKSCRSATRPRSGTSSRCATPTATPTSTPSSAKSPPSIRCSSRTSTARSARGSRGQAASPKRRRAGPRRRARSRARRCPRAPRSRDSRSVRLRAWNPSRAPRLRKARRPPTCPRPHRPGRERTFRSSPKAPTTSTCIRCVAGVQVIAGTVLGHVGAGSGGASSPQGEGAHILFQIRPAGAGAPLIDPKPILDGWVALENTSIFRAKGENPFLATSPTVGQVLLESKQQLEPQVLHDPAASISARAVARRCRREGSTSACWRCSSTCPSRACGRPCRACRALGCDAGGARRQRARERERRDRRDHSRQRHPDRRPPGPGLDRRRHRPQAADARRASRGPQRIVSLMSYPGAAGALASASAARRDPRRLRRARRRGRARRGAVRLRAHPERVDRADRPAGRDPRPDGRQRALERGDSRIVRRRRGCHDRGRGSRWQRLARQALRGAAAAAGRTGPAPCGRRVPARFASSLWARSRSSC